MSREWEIPRIDFNYGWGNRIQLKYEIPWLRLTEGNQTRTGLGNSLFGVKWRFLDEERRGLSLSTYPQIEFHNPTSSADRGLVEKGVQFLLPLEMTRRVGPLGVNGEFGFRFVQHRSEEWLYGLAFGHETRIRLELLGEIQGTARRNFREDDLVFNLGGRWRLGDKFVLLFSIGRSIRAPSGESLTPFAYLGMQFNL